MGGIAVGLLSVVIPALNEYGNIERTVTGIPTRDLSRDGWQTEIIVVDNGSTDGTGQRARELGARVVDEPIRGYGSAYKAGFAAARGDVIATGDADLTYPLDSLTALLKTFHLYDLEFMTTDRLSRSNREAMKSSHALANHFLSLVARLLFGHEFRDSQSGMWIFRRSVLDLIDVRSNGMAFSQEIKNEAFAKGLRCMEVPIEYRVRGGKVKLNAVGDGFSNLCQLVVHRRRNNAAMHVHRRMSSSLPQLSAPTEIADAGSRPTPSPEAIQRRAAN